MLMNYDLKAKGREVGTRDAGFCTNKPNSSIPDHVIASKARQSALRIADRVAARPPSLRPAVSGPRGPSVQTNPIARSLGKRQVLCGKRVMVNQTWAGLRQNKATSRRRRVGRGSGGRGTGVLLHPSTRRPRPCQADRAKQTRFPAGPGAMVRNKANCPKRGTEAVSAPGRRDGSGIRHRIPAAPVRKAPPLSFGGWGPTW